MDVSGGESKVQCKKRTILHRIWNTRFLSQGEFVVVKEEKASMNINILGISALKWTRKGEFKSDDHNILYCGQECLRRNRVALIVKKQNKTKTKKNNVKCATWV